MTTTGRERSPSGSSTRQVEGHLRELAVLHRRLADSLEASAELLREIRLKMDALQKAMGKSGSLEELARGQAELRVSSKPIRGTKP